MDRGQPEAEEVWGQATDRCGSRSDRDPVAAGSGKPAGDPGDSVPDAEPCCAEAGTEHPGTAAGALGMGESSLPKVIRAPARANEFVGFTRKPRHGARPVEPPRVACGGRRRRDGLPCEAPSVPGKKRCRWHGGYSTGPKTAEGKATVATNLCRWRAERREHAKEY